jgi:hypothetical protein
MTEQLSIFISYSRKDSAFVDRLEADLRALNFKTWVDRRKLEGGDEWMTELQNAVESAQVLLLALSPDALESKYVRMEFRHALGLDRTVIPMVVRPVERAPMDLDGLQWVTFLGKSYESALRDLTNALVRIDPEYHRYRENPLRL